MPYKTALEIQGGQPLNGEVSIPGAKNAILPLMASSVLTDKPIVFANVPDISDVILMKNLLESHGVSVSFAGNQVTCRATHPIYPVSNDPTISGKFRASVLLLGPLLARLGHARVYLPGGDAIDSRGRPVDIHVTNLRLLGATVHEMYRENPPYIEATAFSGLRAPRQSITLPKVSVGATQNTIMAACVASGTTTIQNASIEPETLDLIKLLKNLGANIEVDKRNHMIKVTGKNIENFGLPPGSVSLSRYTLCHTVIPDRIVAGTYAIAAAITGGSIELVLGNFPDETILELLESEFWRLLAAGIEITRTARGRIHISRKRTWNGQPHPIPPVSVETRAYPGFPTDLHPQWAALMCFSNGESWIRETIFDDRFKYVEQLEAMSLGAIIFRDPTDPKRVKIYGNSEQQNLGQPDLDLISGDIRAGAALILAALARNGKTRILGLDHIKRGYENVANNFRSCGSQMEEVMVFVE